MLSATAVVGVDTQGCSALAASCSVDHKRCQQSADSAAGWPCQACCGHGSLAASRLLGKRFCSVQCPSSLHLLPCRVAHLRLLVVALQDSARSVWPPSTAAHTTRNLLQARAGQPEQGVRYTRCISAARGAHLWWALVGSSLVGPRLHTSHTRSNPSAQQP